jgi:K+-sensing histidine kinase KdpD
MMKSAAEKLRTTQYMDVALGVILCSVAALVTAAVSAGRPWSIFVPLFFTVVLLVIAGFFGSHAGIVGTVIAALIFAGFLYGPLKSIHVANDSARANLGWMLLIGIAFSFLFAPPTSGLRRH